MRRPRPRPPAVSTNTAPAAAPAPTVYARKLGPPAPAFQPAFSRAAEGQRDRPRMKSHECSKKRSAFVNSRSIFVDGWCFRSLFRLYNKSVHPQGWAYDLETFFRLDPLPAPGCLRPNRDRDRDARRNSNPRRNRHPIGRSRHRNRHPSTNPSSPCWLSKYSFMNCERRRRRASISSAAAWMRPALFTHRAFTLLPKFVRDVCAMEECSAESFSRAVHHPRCHNRE